MVLVKHCSKCDSSFEHGSMIGDIPMKYCALCGTLLIDKEI